MANIDRTTTDNNLFIIITIIKISEIDYSAGVSSGAGAGVLTAGLFPSDGGLTLGPGVGLSLPGTKVGAGVGSAVASGVTVGLGVLVALGVAVGVGAGDGVTGLGVAFGSTAVALYTLHVLLASLVPLSNPGVLPPFPELVNLNL